MAMREMGDHMLSAQHDVQVVAIAGAMYLAELQATGYNLLATLVPVGERGPRGAHVRDPERRRCRCLLNRCSHP
jgi:hypothetical protein